MRTTGIRRAWLLSRRDQVQFGIIAPSALRPDYTVSTVVPTEGSERWREIGVAFASEKGGTITVLLDALPVSGKLVLRPPRAQASDAAG